VREMNKIRAKLPVGMGSIRQMLLNAGLLVLSITCVCLALEYSYRTYLHLFAKPPAPATFAVMDSPPYRYDRVAGFDYGSNNSFTLTFFHCGEPHSFRFVSNAEGNPGRSAPPSNANLTKRLYVYGDSFTFRHYEQSGFRTWPQLMQLRPEILRAGYHVTDYARDGMGVLQMFDFAAHHLRSGGPLPDAIVIAFITDDLRRRRTWRKTLPGRGGPAIAYTSYDPEFRLRTGEYIRTIQVDPKADGTVTPKDVDVIQGITERYQLAATKEDRVGMTLLSSHSLIVNNMLYKLFRTNISAQKYYIDIDDYMKDPQFVDDIAALKQSGIPIFLVLLPRIEALQAGHHLFVEQEQALLDNLVRITGFPLIDVMACGPLPQNPEGLFLLPYDMHPNAKGLRYYADTVARALTKGKPALQLP
jgi:hypothetical protein